ncbi:MAG: hypothetical protein FWF42_00315 [Streptococcaceae bacterium]|nr:hypothetical protein [Streptococcaceae bacterium]MCL2681264.1 hypothetical protein [Streptococcaceae bacterium]MCL2858118.1 hypothetical protein [Streptococcaceae bacterium]
MGENKRAHLGMIQNIITRMGSNSFIIKGWSLTSLGALYAYWIAKQQYLILTLILVATIFFWVHDAYYLRLERGFRNFYDEVRKEEYISNFEIKPIFKESLICTAIKRPILSCEYGFIVFITLILLYIFK